MDDVPSIMFEGNECESDEEDFVDKLIKCFTIFINKMTKVIEEKED